MCLFAFSIKCFYHTTAMFMVTRQTEPIGWKIVNIRRMQLQARGMLRV